MAKENNVLSWENRHLTLQSIESYNNKKLSELDMHKAERHILNCDLCADALEGYGQKAGTPRVRKNLETLRHQIRQKSEDRAKSGSSLGVWGIAASVLAVLGFGLYYFQDSLLQVLDEPQIAMKQEQTEESPSGESFIADDLDPMEEQLSPLEDAAATDPDPGQDLADQEVQTQVPAPTSSAPLPQRATARDGGQDALFSNADLIEETDQVEESDDLDQSELVIEQQTDIVPMTEEHLEATKQTAIELTKSSTPEGSPQLTTSSELSSGAKLGASIMDSDPEPEIGFTEYETYLKDNLQYPEEARLNNVSGVVKIGFNLRPGSIYSKFRIIEGLGYGCDKEAERLIMEGPNWKPAVRNGLVTREEVILEIRFEL